MQFLAIPGVVNNFTSQDPLSGIYPCTLPGTLSRPWTPTTVKNKFPSKQKLFIVIIPRLSVHQAGTYNTGFLFQENIL